MWGIFGKSDKNIEYNPYQVDIHSHLLPDLDDGVKSIKESLEILRQFQSFGFKKVITTPHVMNDYFDNSNEKILSKLDEVRNAARMAGLSIQIYAAA